MSRLIALGCSYTYGHGLPDCHIPPNKPGPNHSKLSWASILAQKLNLELVNMAKPGISNIHILWQLLNFDFKDDDTCVTMWTHFNRHPVSILNDDSSIMYWGSYDDVKYVSGVEHLVDKNLLLKNFISIHHAHLYLRLKNIKHNFLVITWPEVTYQVPSALFMPVFLKGVHLANMLVDKALDNLHPGIKSHQNIANFIYEKFNVIR